MKRVCAWCKTEMGIVPLESLSDEIITHGICEECKNKVLGPRRFALMDFLDSLAAPVVVVDATGSVNSANKQARELLQKELPDIEGFKGGDVFECAFAKDPRGCGNTIHCDACTIRNTVMDTFSSGKSHLETPAYLILGTPDSNQKIQFLISTEKVKDVVLLRIDKVGGN